MKFSRIVIPVAAAFSAALMANSLTPLPARATLAPALAMTPARCQALSRKEHLTCHHGPIARASEKMSRVHMTLALKKIPYDKSDHSPAGEPRPAK
jgi:hypothetical protein